MWHPRDYVRWLTCLQFSVCLCSGPPEKPSNLSCITYYDKNMTCRWNPGKDKHITSSYQLKLFIPSIPLQSCIPENSKNSCTIFYPDLRYYVDYTIWVEAKNNFGKTDSDHLVLDIMNSVKPEPIFITSIQPGHGLSRSLIVKWKNPLKLPKVFPLKYHLRYRMAKTADWIEADQNETSHHAEFFMIKGLRPFTKYIVAIRCVKQDGKGYWSDWSLEKTGTTSEDRPSQGPNLWIVNKNPNSQNRPVLIMWKELSKSEAKGIIKGYQLKIKEKKSQAVMCINSTNLEYSLILSGESYVISITAYNSVGNSPESVLLVPSANQKELPAVQYVSAIPHNDQLMVEWKAPSSTVNTYIVEWCVADSDSNECSGLVDWIYKPNTTNKAFVKENVLPFKRHKISVYPLYNDGPGSPLSTKAYLQQDSPAFGPFVHLKKTGKTTAQLEWDEIPVNERRGFITNYTIFCKNAGENESYVTVGSASRQHTLVNLKSNTLYRVIVMASTAKGSTNGTAISFKTLAFAKQEIAAIMSSTILVSLSVTIMMLFAYFMNKTPKMNCQNVPDAAYSHLTIPKCQTKNNFDGKELGKASESIGTIGRQQQSIFSEESESYWISSRNAEDPAVVGSCTGQLPPSQNLQSTMTCLLLNSEEEFQMSVKKELEF
ncbi:interleukin-6 receptor subunit beta-like [Chiloscyllium punctatum]|uniref:Fibronectin type-III domain-containing protein n=1 Tax=Chiloscyllium punctatum TaxID=137246 RepID=A0A401S8J6_CHIPU|nr:hypothetical protein [Chiloscyllium punctatum]